MRKPIFVSAQEAVGMIQDYSTLCTIGMTLVSASETVLKAIEQKFLDTGNESHRRALGSLSSFHGNDFGKPFGGIQPSAGADGQHVPQHGTARTWKIK